MNKLKESMNYLFNWKKNSASVFFFSIPLAIMGFSLHGIYTYLMWNVHGQCGYSLILLGGLVLLGMGLWPVRKRLLSL